MEKLFVPLHVHTAMGSLLDSIITIDGLVNKAQTLNCPACAVTDHGNMSSAIQFYTQCRKKNIKPIIGLEAYITQDLNVKEAGTKYYHLVLLAKNATGYRNLMELSSIGHLQGFYRKPRIDFRTLQKYADGVICLSACMQGEIAQAILNNEPTLPIIAPYVKLFQDDFYLEVQCHTDETQRYVNEQIVKLAKEHGIRLVATTDAHFLDEDDAEAHDIFIRISQDRDTQLYSECYLQDYQTMVEKLASSIGKELAISAVENTVMIADKCNLEIDLGHSYLPHNASVKEKDEFDEMMNICRKILKDRGLDNEVYRKRLEFEADVIHKKDFQGYFLILRDLIMTGKQKGIPFGVGRGSDGGSLVCYLMDITDIDPIQYDLDFGRFLTVERKDLPDCDTDVSTRRRGEFISLITQKYGVENVSQIGTFGTLASKSVLDAVGKVLQIPKDVITECKKILKEDTGVKSLVGTSVYKTYGHYIDMCIKLENLPRSSGAHAGGVCISGNNQPITAYSPVKFNKKGGITTQYEMHDVESAGLVKFDMLGLVTLDIISDACELVGHTYYGYPFNYEDEKVFQMMCEGDTSAVFQAETNFMTNVFTQVRPKDLNEWSDCIAIGRPDSIKFLEPYVKAKYEGIYPEEIHPKLTQLLSRTYGCLIYQEQIMNITKVFAGFSDGEADAIRKCIAKKQLDKLPAQLAKFREGAIKNGYDSEVIEKIIQLLQDNANYSFNMAHSVAYAITGYRTAYLKYYHPVEFMCAVLNNQRKEDELTGTTQIDYEGIAIYVADCKNRGIQIQPPNINLSGDKFKPIRGQKAITYGFELVKGLGSDAVVKVMQNRPYKSYKDFIDRVGIHFDKTSVISLIKSGACDSITELTREKMLKCFYSQRFDNKQEDMKPITTVNKNHIQWLFERGLINEDQKKDKELCVNTLNKARKSEGWVQFQDKYMQGTILDWEMETVNAFMSGDPFDGVKIPDWASLWEGDYGWAGGTIKDVKQVVVKKGKHAGDKMAFINLATQHGVVDCVVFSEKWKQYQQMLKFGKNVMIEGEKTGDLSMTVSKVITLEEYKVKVSRNV